jgi:hypothetical protein
MNQSFALLRDLLCGSPDLPLAFGFPPLKQKTPP